MTAIFRIILILASLGTWIYISRKLKKAQVDTHDTIFWIFFSVILILISLFPRIADWLSARLGIYSTVNMVFLIIIFALLLRVFLLTIKCSQMDHRIKILVEELALREKKDEKKRRKWVKPAMTPVVLKEEGEGKKDSSMDAG